MSRRLFHVQGEHAQLSLHVFDIELLLDLLRKPAYKAQQVFEKLVAGNMVTGVQVSEAVYVISSHACPRNTFACDKSSMKPKTLHMLSCISVAYLFCISARRFDMVLPVLETGSSVLPLSAAVMDALLRAADPPVDVPADCGIGL